MERHDEEPLGYARQQPVVSGPAMKRTTRWTAECVMFGTGRGRLDTGRTQDCVRRAIVEGETHGLEIAASIVVRPGDKGGTRECVILTGMAQRGTPSRPALQLLEAFAGAVGTAFPEEDWLMEDIRAQRFGTWRRQRREQRAASVGSDRFLPVDRVDEYLRERGEDVHPEMARALLRWLGTSGMFVKLDQVEPFLQQYVDRPIDPGPMR